MKELRKPQIRFAGFTDDWEQRKLGEIFDQTFNFTNPEKDNFELYSLTVEDGLTPKTDRYKRDFLVIKQDQFKLVEPYGFVYNPMNITLGAIDYNKLSNSVAVSGYYTTMSVKYGFDHNFLNIFLSSNTAIEIYRSQATGTLKEKQRVQFPTFSTLSIFVPSFEEQTAIGNFFKQLDETIALHQRECEKYQNLKKSYLDKMFPKENELFPELRFPEFTDAWEQRKLGEIVHFYSGLTYSPNNVVENGTLVLRSSNVQENQIVTDDSVFVDPNVVNSDNVQIGDIIVVVRNGSKNLIGKHARIQSVMSNTVIGAFMTGIRSPNPEFLSALLDTQKFNDEIDKNLGATINQITTGNFKQMEFSFPSEEEQTTIGNFFKQLDETIALHQRELEKYKQIKQSYLEKMFI